MSTNAALGRLFAAASVALFGIASIQIYHTHAQERTQLVVAQPPSPSNVSSHAPSTPQVGSSATEVVPSFPVVLPPNTAAAQASAQASNFLQRCTDAAVYGLPSSAEVRCYGGYLASLNYERRIPNWVMEVVDSRRLRAARRPSSDGSSSTSSGADEATHDNEDAHGSEEVSRNRSRFYADDTVPAAFRVGPDSYTSRGLSRGHLAPAQLHKGSQAEMDATFNMNANIVPQDMTLNATDWLRLETLTRKLSREVGVGRGNRQRNARGGQRGVDTVPGSTEEADGEDRGRGGALYVVTGPVFMPQAVRVERRPDGTEVHVPLSSTGETTATPKGVAAAGTTIKTMMMYDMTGDLSRGTLVAVPSHMFKVLLAEEDDGRDHSVAAFMLPNGPIAEQRPLTAYQVPLDRLERLTGLQFFPGLDGTRLPDLCKRHTCDARPSAMFQKYRQVAQLRAADSVPQLRQRYAALQALVMKDGGKLDDVVVREFEKRTEELIAEAVVPTDTAERR